MILTAKERGFDGRAVREPGEQFEVADDFVVPSWCEGGDKPKRGSRKKAADDGGDSNDEA